MFDEQASHHDPFAVTERNQRGLSSSDLIKRTLSTRT
jgi:hypothetical protein